MRTDGANGPMQLMLMVGGIVVGVRVRSGGGGLSAMGHREGAAPCSDGEGGSTANDRDGGDGNREQFAVQHGRKFGKHGMRPPWSLGELGHVDVRHASGDASEG